MEASSAHPQLPDDPELARLAGVLSSLGSAAVAYSGGVDSTFLLKVAHAVLGERVVGVLAVSESLDRTELEDAERLAAREGLPLVRIETREIERPEYRRNDGNRCYHCKDELFREVRRVAAERGLRWVLDGSHAGDRGEYRPGLRARDEQGVRSPLMEAGLDKEAIRRLSRELGLPTWDKPAAPCLASRIPYGSEVTWEKLRQVEAVEAALAQAGFRIRRVRHHGALARIEVPRERIAELLEPPVLAAIVEAAKGAGFLYVTVDLEGFRSGSLNAALGEGQGSARVGVPIELSLPRPAGPPGRSAGPPLAP